MELGLMGIGPWGNVEPGNGENSGLLRFWRRNECAGQDGRPAGL